MKRRERRNGRSLQVGGVLAGALIGGLVAGGIALVKAPQSGDETVRQIRKKVAELQDKTEEIVLGAQERLEQVTTQFADRAAEMQAGGATVVKEAQEHLEKLVEETKKSVEVVSGA